jgi:hypothetical protein
MIFYKYIYYYIFYSVLFVVSLVFSVVVEDCFNFSLVVIFASNKQFKNLYFL